MIKLKDILNEVQLSKYQLFATGTGGRGGGNWKFDGKKLPTGKLKIYNPMSCGNKPAGVKRVNDLIDFKVNVPDLIRHLD